MKLTSLFNGKVQWRTFNKGATDSLISRHDGWLEFGETDEITDQNRAQLPSEGVQIQIKLDALPHTELVSPTGQSQVFKTGEHWAIVPDGNNARIRRFIFPSITMELSPDSASAADIYEGSPLKIKAHVDLGDERSLPSSKQVIDRLHHQPPVIEVWRGNEQLLTDLTTHPNTEADLDFFATIDLRIPDMDKLLGDLSIVASAEMTTGTNAGLKIRSTPIKLNVKTTPKREYKVEWECQGETSISPGAAPVLRNSGDGAPVEIKLTANSEGIFRDVAIEVDTRSGLKSTMSLTSGDGKKGSVWTGNFGLPPNVPSPTHADGQEFTLTVVDKDFFGVEHRTPFKFKVVDVTPPTIVITEPAPDACILLPDSQMMGGQSAESATVTIKGTVLDIQSGYKEGSLSCILPNGNTQAIAPGPDGSWEVPVPDLASGFYRIPFKARDNAGNEGSAFIEFEVAKAFKPKTIEELLGSTAYLRELISFARREIGEGDGTPLNSRALDPHFGQGFTRLYSGEAADADTPVSDLLLPIRLLRDKAKDTKTLLPLAHWTFSPKAGSSGPDYSSGGLIKLAAVTGTIGRKRQGGGRASSITPNVSTVIAAALPLRQDGGISLDGRSYIRVEHHPALELGKDNADFSVSFWINPDNNGSGKYRTVLLKGDDSQNHRTFALFLHQNTNRLHFRISTETNANDGGDSLVSLRANSWSHIAYVKSGGRLRLYINGQLDSDIKLSGLVVANSDPLWIGNSTTNPHSATGGYEGGLSDLRIYPFALDGSAVDQIARERAINPAPDAMADYHQAAWEAAIISIGISPASLRSLSSISAKQKLELARQIGLATEYSATDGLSFLVPKMFPPPPPPPPARLNPAGPMISVATTSASAPEKPRTGPHFIFYGDDRDLIPIQPGSEHFENWLADTFGIPRTSSVNAAPPPSPCRLVFKQREILLADWQREDAAPKLDPDLDPDIVSPDDLVADAQEWRSLLNRRMAELESRKQAILASGEHLATLVSDVLQSSEADKILQMDSSGEDIGEDIAKVGLTIRQFRKLLRYRQVPDIAVPTLGSPYQTRPATISDLSAFEREDFADLLVQLWKQRECYPKWRVEEAQMQRMLWPTLFSAPAWHDGNFRNEFKPWRGNAEARHALEARMSARLRAWREIDIAHAQLVTNVQRETLPKLRDDLLGTGNFPSLAGPLYNDLTSRWLVDFGASSSTSITPVEQAIASMQTLINGVRNGWFEHDHPAHSWKIRPAAPAAVGFDEFDSQWARIDSYGRWRSAVMNYLFPENVLYPELLAKPVSNAAPFLKINYEAFDAFRSELRKFGQLTSADLSNEPLASLRENVVRQQKIDTNGNLDPSGWLTDNPYFFHAQIAVGLAFQRSGNFRRAMDEYRQVYDVVGSSQPDSQHGPHVTILKEWKSHPARGKFVSDWIRKSEDPHLSIGIDGDRGPINPYTRFTLFQILTCTLGLADDAFASGTKDGLAKALALYLEAEDILAFEELVDHPPLLGGEVYLPNPVLEGFRLRTSAGLRKLRRGLSYLGTPMPPDLTREGGGGQLSSLTRPTPYRFRVLMERAKQLTAQAQQLEGQYLSAMERRDGEEANLLSLGFGVQSAEQSRDLRKLHATEVGHSKTSAQLQLGRTEIQRERTADWLEAGPNRFERAQMEHLWAGSTARQVANIAETAVGAAQAAGSAANIADIIGSGGAKVGIAIGMATATAAAGIARGIAMGHETQGQASAIQASWQRRQEEWQLQLGLASQDARIGAQGIVLAEDRIAIANQELKIAESQLEHAKQMLAFHHAKDTSFRFYQWYVGELRSIYATFLRMATVIAQQAEHQLAFERQEAPARLIKSDYWQLAKAAAASTADAQGNNAIDPKGITGSTRLLQDLHLVDQHAFSTESRLLNLTQSFSLSQMMPAEFAEFRRTGILTFSTPMQAFDEGFPGHYMRLIKKVRVSVVALIPPSQGIRATLGNGGLSRVVTADPGYPTMVVQQPPQIVALTSPVASTGVFELDMQSELLYPFEGTGVDTNWFLELPPAGNRFDFDSLMDVIVSFEYTAKFSPELKERVIKSLPRRVSGVSSISVKRDLPDVWYELVNSRAPLAPEPDRVVFEFGVSERDFPAGLTAVRIENVATAIRDVDGKPCRYQVSLNGPTRKIANQHGIASASSSISVPVTTEKMTVILSNSDDDPFLDNLRAGTVDDILIAMTFEGTKPPWNS